MTLAVPSAAQASETEQAEGEADVQLGFGLTNVDSLDFGTIALGPTGGAVTVNAGTGTISKVGDIALVGTPGHRAAIRWKRRSTR